ncbi:hypothetical protein BRD00_03075 [Halobacteriales archaeon QS_8_69_26]|nr:MAG: hypothetical protein BRD00_03075 [Halobacteriales archaeon QS_8_69_26]
MVRSDGFGLFGHDADGTVVVRTDLQGHERWRGRYAPYDEGADDGPPDRGHSMIPVDGDQFVTDGDVRTE